MNIIQSDSCDEAFSFYEAIYKDFAYRGYISRFRRNVADYMPVNDVFIVSGDICFNIKFSSQKDCIGSLVPVDKQVPEILNTYLHSCLNMSILPVQGQLNNIKKGIGDDRMDTFIWALNMYYSGESKALFLNNGNYKQSNMPTRLNVAAFLDNFEDVYHFCKIIYGISGKIVDRMINSGSQALITLPDLENYVHLAVDFWKERELKYRKIETIKEYLPGKEDIINHRMIKKWFEDLQTDDQVRRVSPL